MQKALRGKAREKIPVCKLRIHSMLQSIGCGGYSSAAERLTVAQDVVGSIPTSRPNNYHIYNQ